MGAEVILKRQERKWVKKDISTGRTTQVFPLRREFSEQKMFRHIPPEDVNRVLTLAEQYNLGQRETNEALRRIDKLGREAIFPISNILSNVVGQVAKEIRQREKQEQQ